MTIEEKLIDLETRFSYQDDLLQELNEVVAKQDKKIELLESQLRMLAEKVNDIRAEIPAADSSAQNELPPHY